jgi:MFS family permease
MKNSPGSLSNFWARLSQDFSRLTAGGRWTDRMSPAVTTNLRWFWFDGLFAQATEAITTTYLSLYVLALGATSGQIGLMSALSSLSAALLLLPGASIVERGGNRKLLCLFGGGGVSRVALLMLALLPVMVTGAPLIYIAIGLTVIRDAFANLALPAWVSLTADIVPLRWRGRYFSSRNIAMGVAGMVVTYVVGLFITQIGTPGGYQLALGLAFATGMISTFSFAQLKESSAARPMPELKTNLQPAPPRSLGLDRNFLMLCATAALWNFSLNTAGPFFNVYLVRNLKATALMVGLLSVVSSLASLPALRLFGLLTDRWGPRRVQLVTGLLIPIAPWVWTIATSPWHIVPVNLVNGFLWAGYNLAAFNFMLALTPDDRRARYSAIYQIVVMGALAGGAALGGLITTHWGYTPIFIISSLGRFSAALFFARFVREAPASATRLSEAVGEA